MRTFAEPRFRRLAALATLAMAALISTAAAQPYAFTVITSDTRFDPFEFGSPSINDAGQVAFRARDLDSVQGVYRGDGGPLTPIAVDGPALNFNFIGYFPVIDASGRVCFPATYDDGEAIYRGGGGPLAVMADTLRDNLNFIAFLPSMNDAGLIALQAERADFRNALFRADDLGVTELPTPALDNDFGAPAINDHGDILFAAETIPAGLDGLFRFSAGSVSTVEIETGPLDVFLGAPSFNSAGHAAFTAITDEGQEGLYIRDAAGLHQIAGHGDDVFLFGDPCLSDAGRLLFSANTVADFNPVILLDGQVIIQGGDPLDGSTVVGLTTGRFALNNNGQFAFIAQLADGRAGIYRADPVACPADLTGDGLVDFADYLEFLNLYDALDLRIDFTGDGLVDFSDYLEFLNLYETGC